MIIKNRENLQELYRSEYTKNSQYKNNKLSNLKSVNSFTLSIEKEEKLEYIYQ